MTLEVSNLDRYNDFKDEHPLNIPFMFVTCEVSSSDKSKEDNDVQPSNIKLISLINEVLK